MNHVYEDKRRIYSVNLAKETIPVLIQTQSHHIRGLVHADQGERLSEKLDKTGTFLSITKATIFDFQGVQEVYRTNYISISQKNIIWIMPLMEIEEVKTVTQQSDN